MNLPQQAASAAERAAQYATYGGAGGAVASGGARFLGFTSDEWAILGAVAGVGIAFLGWVSGTLISIYYKEKHLRLAEKLGRPGGEP